MKVAAEGRPKMEWVQAGSGCGSAAWLVLGCEGSEQSTRARDRWAGL